jgi:hypothetical protein
VEVRRGARLVRRAAIRGRMVPVDLTGWTPVTGADGAVLGWMAPADTETPHERAQRLRVARLRADAIGQAAALLGDPVFGLDEAYEAAEAAMPGPMVNAAGHIAVTLAEIEHYGLLSDD